MGLLERSPILGGMDSTVFFETPSISPSSLAFFVSGFKELDQETKNGVKLLVSVRETETDNTEKLFIFTETILDSVESFMGVTLQQKVLHSVALPGYEKEFGAFYSFNYYR